MRSSSGEHARETENAEYLVDRQIATAEELLDRLGWRTDPIRGEPDAAGRIPERDANRIGTAWTSIVGHIELQIAVAGYTHGRGRVGDVANVGGTEELRLARRCGDDCRH